jgi:hypothetical protein
MVERNESFNITAYLLKKTLQDTLKKVLATYYSKKHTVTAKDRALNDEYKNFVIYKTVDGVIDSLHSYVFLEEQNVVVKKSLKYERLLGVQVSNYISQHTKKLTKA